MEPIVLPPLVKDPSDSILELPCPENSTLNRLRQDLNLDQDFAGDSIMNQTFNFQAQDNEEPMTNLEFAEAIEFQQPIE